MLIRLSWRKSETQSQSVELQRIQMEEIMPEQSSMHFYLSWSKQRIDEMDATLASLEAKAGQVKADRRQRPINWSPT